MTGDQEMDNGEVEDAKVLPCESPSDRHLPGVGKEEMEIEDEETGPSSYAVEGREAMES